uniref:Uncharacterized protein n=1 Tax=Trypanosoma congolense (strain IL3000) TaxID=1068625 RepID=G0V1P5_TRYCI|nr:hypothetical protein, unlikely [Trypanosoma congolense IL3000]
MWSALLTVSTNELRTAAGRKLHTNFTANSCGVFARPPSPNPECTGHPHVHRVGTRTLPTEGKRRTGLLYTPLLLNGGVVPLPTHPLVRICLQCTLGGKLLCQPRFGSLRSQSKLRFCVRRAPIHLF